MDLGKIPAWPEPGDPVGRRLVTALQQLVDTEVALFTTPERADARSFQPKATYLAPQREVPLAWRTGLLAGSATFVVGALGYASGVPVAGVAALGVCIFSMVLGSMALPQLIAPKLLTGVVVGVTVATRELRRIRRGEGPLRGTMQAHVARVLAAVNLLLALLWLAGILYLLWGDWARERALPKQ